MGNHIDSLIRERDAMQSRINLLTDKCREQEQEIEYLKRFERGGQFWLRMQNHIRDHSQLQDSWKEFFTMYAICVPNLDELR